MMERHADNRYRLTLDALHGHQRGDVPWPAILRSSETRADLDAAEAYLDERNPVAAQRLRVARGMDGL